MQLTARKKELIKVIVSAAILVVILSLFIGATVARGNVFINIFEGGEYELNDKGYPIIKKDTELRFDPFSGYDGRQPRTEAKYEVQNNNPAPAKVSIRLRPGYAGDLGQFTRLKITALSEDSSLQTVFNGDILMLTDQSFEIKSGGKIELTVTLTLRSIPEKINNIPVVIDDPYFAFVLGVEYGGGL